MCGAHVIACVMGRKSQQRAFEAKGVEKGQAMPKRESRVRTQAHADAIIDGIANGIPLRELCRNLGIGKSEVYCWQADDSEFAGRIARARVLGFDALAEEALQIADDATNDWITRQRQDGTGGRVFDSEHVQRSRLRVETRLKLLAKWDPKRYGEKLDLSSSDGTMSPTPPVYNIADK